LNDKNRRRGGEVCVQQPDGSYSDAAIHEQIMDGVDTSDFEMETRAKLLAKGVPVSVLDLVLPVKNRN
jgi:hypothetical protein